jgi:hypothetical protein
MGRSEMAKDTENAVYYGRSVWYLPAFQKTVVGSEDITRSCLEIEAGCREIQLKPVHREHESNGICQS